MIACKNAMRGIYNVKLWLFVGICFWVVEDFAALVQKMLLLKNRCLFPQVLYADGTVAVHTGSWLKPQTFDSSPQSRASLHSAAGDRETPTKKGL